MSDYEASNISVRPRLTFRIGITGHRPNKIPAQQMTKLSACAESVLGCISDAATDVQREHATIFAPVPPELRLATSLAEGADTMLAQVARALHIRLDVILPFPIETYAASQQFSEDARRVFDELLVSPPPNSLLELGNAPQDERETNESYLSAGRRVVAHSDLMITIWDGQLAEGVGGTAQILHEAIDRGVPIVWIKPEGSVCLVTAPNQLHNFDAQTTLDTERSLDQLVGLVSSIVKPPAPETIASIRLKRYLSEPIEQPAPWKAYKIMRRFLIGKELRRAEDAAGNANAEDSWERYNWRAKEIGGEHFANTLRDRLAARWDAADQVALFCSHAYRSAYVLNFLLAGLAVIAGLLSVFWWTSENSVIIKSICVLIEVLSILTILKLTRKGHTDEEDWHARWLEARSAAELLRSAKLLSLVGTTAAPMKELTDHNDQSWVSWYIRATLRELGPPTVCLDCNALRTAIESSIEDEIDDQIRYNKTATASYHQIDHQLHVWGERLFKMTFIVGLIYLALAGSYIANSTWPVFTLSIETLEASKSFIKSVVTVLGAGLPAMGAALFGIRATGDFRLASEQAEQTKKELEAHKQRLQKLALAPDRERTSQHFLALTQTLTSDLRDWAKIYRFRELQLPA